MSCEPHIENGFATVAGGSYLIHSGQPAAAMGGYSQKYLRGIVVPDRRAVVVAESKDGMCLSSKKRPFLTHLAVTDELKVVSSKLLVAPLTARTSGRLMRVIPMSFRNAFPVTVLSSGWVVFSTASRIKRFVVEEGEILTIKQDAVVAWTGKEPRGFCPKLRLGDVLLPQKRTAALSLNFYGPALVWAEGCDEL